jgi:hypothetical protein
MGKSSKKQRSESKDGGELDHICCCIAGCWFQNFVSVVVDRERKKEVSTSTSTFFKFAAIGQTKNAIGKTALIVNQYSR